MLLVLFGFIALLLAQTRRSPSTRRGRTPPSRPAGSLVLFGYFVWAPRYLTHKQLTARDLVASAALTSVGIVVLMLVSSFAMAPWIDLYAKDFSGLGVFMALFFWLGLSSTVVVACASLSPVLAGRRDISGRGRDTSSRFPSNFFPIKQEGAVLVAYSFGQVMWTMFVFFAWILFFWLLFTVFGDLFSRHDIGGG